MCWSAVRDYNVCDEYKLAIVKQQWKNLWSMIRPELKLYIIKAIFIDIIQYNEYVANQFKIELLRETGGSLEKAAQLFADLWDAVIDLYPDLNQLKYRIRYDATAWTELARVFYGNAPWIGNSLLK